MFSVNSSKNRLAEGESKNGDAISPGFITKDGKSSRDGNPDQSESAKGVEAQLRGSRAGCIKKTDPYEGTGATLNSLLVASSTNNQWEIKCVYKRHLFLFNVELLV